MTNEAFNSIVRQTFQDKSELLTAKSRLYGSDSDRLIQFKLMANLSGLSPELCAFILASKHFTALKNALTKPGTKLFVIDEITGDLINYMILIKALFMESSNEPADMGQISTNNLQRGITEFKVFEQETWGGPRP